MPPQPLFLKVAVPTPLRQSFDYLPPRGISPEALAPGARLKVPFGRRSTIGILLGTSTSPSVEEARIKPASALLDDEPVVTNPILSLCTWAADYYHHPVGEVMATALPALLRQGEPVSKPIEELVISATGKEIPLEELGRAPAQAALLKRLRSASGMSRAEIRQEDFGRSVVNALVEKGLAAWTTRRPEETSFDSDRPLTDKAFVDLNAEQQSAIEAIESEATGTTLLFGVTGSGKTEVYLSLIETHLRAGRQALVLVPEIGLTPQTIRRFTDRFSVPVTTIHSGLTDRERLDAWSAARSGRSGVVIGTRSAIFCPLKHPGILIVDEEHDSSFKQQDGFRYSARDLAVMRGQMEKVPVVLGSATPSLETWQNAASGKYRKVTLTERATGATQPAYQVINLRDAAETGGFSQQLIDLTGRELDRGNQVLVFLNRRGYAPVILCRSCGWMSHCHRCDARMTFHKTLNKLICHHCGSESGTPEQCPACTSGDLVPLGAGTQRVERTLAELFKGFPVLRVDRDSTRGRHAMEELLAEIHKGEPSILVGTQLLAKGHHFPDVTLVAIADMDSGFYSGNYRAEERMAQLILQVGGRSGRAEKPGTVAIQTHLPEQPLFKRLIGQGYAAFADELLTDRRSHELPPFFHQALLRAEAQNAKAPEDFLEDVSSGVTPPPSVMLLGPVPATMERKAGRYRYHLLLTADNRKRLSTTLDQCIAAAEQSRFSRRVRWSVDVDPLELF